MAPAAPVPTLHDLDLKLLRVFVTIVRNGGFSSAITELNISQSTISGYMASLETRLGMRLCERGRGGFMLTEDGQAVFDAAQELFLDLDRFRGRIGAGRREIVGTYSIGMVDGVAEIGRELISKALRLLIDRAPNLDFDLRLGSPQALIRQLLDGRFDAVVLPVFRDVGGVTLIPIDPDNKQTLYCGKGHPFFDRADESISDEELATAAFATRMHMEGWSDYAKKHLNARASTVDVECQLILVLTGRYISYLPESYVESWIVKGAIRPILRDQMTYGSPVQLAVRSNDHSNATRVFVDSVKDLQKDR